MTEFIINRLQQETSPYLRQHANQPIAWHPWGEEAIKLAREQNKPILLSIGYSACHWCHVMSAESFCDPVIAAFMNEHFVNIKVDREERPDIDKIYQTAFQVMHHQPGGWPLTAMITPHQLIPFFIGTYFPKHSAERIPSFLDVLEQTAAFYRAYHATIEESHRPLIEALKRLNHQSVEMISTNINTHPMTIARIEYEEIYDEEHGGFGTSPKFPNTGNIRGLMHYWFLSKQQKEEDKTALTMATNSLMQMSKGGIRDHLGGGFFRYSVDAKWRIPHFEKMLYDNALLLSLYSQIYQCDPNPRYQEISNQVIAWLTREMCSPEGGFYATLSADSEGEEGKYYLWDRDTVQELVSTQEHVVLSEYFGLDAAANFHGQWHLINTQSLDKIATAMKISEKQANKHLQSGLKKLFSARETRVRPNRDDKILTAWNALTIKALSQHAKVFDSDNSIGLAEQCLQFLYKNQWQDKRLYAVYMEGRQPISGFLDDYAFLLDAIISFLQVKWDNRWLQWAIELADALLMWFEDEEVGGFYFTSHDQAPMIYRPKPLMEDALPSGNGVAAQALLVLGYLVGNVRYLTAAERTIQMAQAVLHDRPSFHEALLAAFDLYSHFPQMIVLRGSEHLIQSWQSITKMSYHPRRFVFTLPADSVDLPPILAQKSIPDTPAAAFICQGAQCMSPITELDAFQRFLAEQV